MDMVDFFLSSLQGTSRVASMEEQLVKQKIRLLTEELADLERQKQRYIQQMGRMAASLGSFTSTADSWHQMATTLAEEVEEHATAAYALSNSLGEAEGWIEQIREDYKGKSTKGLKKKGQHKAGRKVASKYYGPKSKRPLV